MPNHRGSTVSALLMAAAVLSPSPANAEEHPGASPPPLADSSPHDGLLGPKETAYILWAAGGVLMVGGIATAIAGGVAANNRGDSLAVAGFVAGGTSMVFAGAAPAAVGLLIHPWDGGTHAGAPMGGTLRVRF